MHYSTPFYIKAWSICEFWYPQGVQEPIAHVQNAQLYSKCITEQQSSKEYSLQQPPQS